MGMPFFLRGGVSYDLSDVTSLDDLEAGVEMLMSPRPSLTSVIRTGLSQPPRLTIRRTSRDPREPTTLASD